ncbi:MAG: hypothetical protein HZA90_17395 [Verrucomicrobia bacterium]|nr:hypothetical protein [Verrucomicrobiota bacterium]
MVNVAQANPLWPFPPARLTSEQAGPCLGFRPHDIPVLVRRGLLRPLGHPRNAAVKYFAFVVLERLRADVNWLARATDAVYEEWQRKNARKKAKRDRTLRAKNSGLETYSTTGGENARLGDEPGA